MHYEKTSSFVECKVPKTTDTRSVGIKSTVPSGLASVPNINLKIDKRPMALQALAEHLQCVDVDCVLAHEFSFPPGVDFLLVAAGEASVDPRIRDVLG